MKKIVSIAIWLALIGVTQVGVSAPQSPDYEYVFENPQVLSFDISMSEEAYQQMQPKRRDSDRQGVSSRSMFGLKFDYVEGAVTCGDETYTGVGVRHRGNASMVMIPPDGKKAYKLDFDRFHEGQTFHGFKKLNFINCFRDPSMLRDKLTYDLMRNVGIPAPRATFANLYLTIEGKTREHLGLFVVVEQVDRVFLGARFGNSDGLLIKGEIVNDLEYRGEEWEEYAHDYELKSSKTDSDTSRPFSRETMHAEIDRQREFIADAVAADPHKLYPAAAFEMSFEETVEPNFSIFSGGIIGLKPFVTDRLASVRAQLAGQKKGHKFEHTPMGDGPPPPQEDTETKRKALKAQLEGIEASLEQAPDNAQLYVEKGNVMGELTQVSEMMDQLKYVRGMTEAYEKALALDSENVGAHLGRGMVRFFSPKGFGGDLDGAASDFQSVVHSDSANVRGHFFLGLTYKRQNAREKAIDQFEKVLALDPDNRDAKQQLEELRSE